MKLRPHHMYCSHYLGLFDPSRGEEYIVAREKIQSLFKEATNDIEITKGPDALCESCPYLDNRGCAHPNGDEQEVQKWDNRIIEGLNLSYGQVIKVKAIKSLIKEKSPIGFCINKCPYYRKGKCDPNTTPETLR